MATTTVLEYERIINDSVKKIIRETPDLTRPPLTSRKITPEERVALEGDAPLKVLKDILNPKMMDRLILEALSAPMSDYSRHATKGPFSSRTKHHSAAEHIHTLVVSNKTIWNSYLQDPAKNVDLPFLIGAIERSTMRPPVNPKGSYANLCRAIVHTVDGLRGCEFTQAFKDRLGIEAPKPTSIHTSETGVKMKEGSSVELSRAFRNTMNSINPKIDTNEEPTHQTTDEKPHL